MNWFNKLFNKVSGLKKTYNDLYQIRKVELFDGTLKYYAEYRDGSLDNWAQLFKVNGNYIEKQQLTVNELYIDSNYSQDTEDVARELILAYKQQLILNRAKDFKNEEIIKVD